MIWFVWVLKYINHYWLFNAKSFLNIDIKYTAFGLVEFYGISTIVGYLTNNLRSIIYLHSFKYTYMTCKWKGMNRSILSLIMGNKKVRQNVFFNLGKAISLGERKPWI